MTGEEAFYSDILRAELVPAFGCTEPIAIAYAAATAAAALGSAPERLRVECSGNVVKNVKGVVVPGTGGLKGIDAAAAFGAIAGDARLGLEVLSRVDPERAAAAQAFVAEGRCAIGLIPDEPGLRIVVRAEKGASSGLAEIRDAHANVVRVEKDGESLDPGRRADLGPAPEPDYSRMTLRGIYDYCAQGDIAGALPVLKAQETHNTAIAEEGLRGLYGEMVGRTLLRSFGDAVGNKARAMAAAGSDARMSGCALPVVINSGSGNQGLTVSLPVLEYAKDLGVDDDRKYRALALSNLVSIHVKRGIGKLSAFCGAVSAACGSGAAITFVSGGDYRAVCRTITNTLANVSGIVCDGAKPSCAAKIASAVDAAIIAHALSADEKVFRPGEGIVMEDIEATIASVARIGRDGMRSTDREILDIMIGR